MNEQRRLTRSEDDRVLGGVAAGLAEYYGLDPTLVRIGFVVFAVFGGSGILLYLALWVVIPRPGVANQPASTALRDGVAEMRESATRLVDDVRAGWRGGPSTTGHDQPADRDDPPQDDLTGS